MVVALRLMIETRTDYCGDNDTYIVVIVTGVVVIQFLLLVMLLQVYLRVEVPIIVIDRHDSTDSVVEGMVVKVLVGGLCSDNSRNVGG